MKQKMLDTVLDVIKELNPTLPQPVSIEQGSNAALFGQEGVLDSMALVTLILALEEKIEADFNVSIVLANEKALSARNSPFRTIASLASFSERLVMEGGSYA